VILTTNRSLDEKYLWSGLKREKRMKRLVRKLADAGMRPLAPPPAPIVELPKERATQSMLDRFG
jgi:ERCC4-related helicase